MVEPSESSIGDPLPDEITTVMVSGHTFDPTDVSIYEFLIQGVPNPLDLEGIEEAIELFEHTLDKKALVWFQEQKEKLVDVTTLKMMFLQRYNPWGKTKRDQLQS